MVHLTIIALALTLMRAPLLTSAVLHLIMYQPIDFYVPLNVEIFDRPFLNLALFYYPYVNKHPFPNYLEPLIEQKYVYPQELELNFWQ